MQLMPVLIRWPLVPQNMPVTALWPSLLANREAASIKLLHLVIHHDANRTEPAYLETIQALSPARQGHQELKHISELTAAIKSGASMPYGDVLHS